MEEFIPKGIVKNIEILNIEQILKGVGSSMILVATSIKTARPHSEEKDTGRDWRNLCVGFSLLSPSHHKEHTPPQQ